MLTIVRDPLLTAARVIIIVIMVLLGIAAAALVIAAGYLAYDPSPLLVELVDEGVAHPSAAVIRAIIGVILLALVPLGLVFVFLSNLGRVIESVGAGDPFAPVNATRLARMGWLIIGVQLSSVPIGALAMWIGERVKDVDFEFGISGEGIVLALVLFILARVFRRGAEMREELEGTV